MTTFNELGLALKVHDPLVSGGAWLYNLAPEVEAYTHTLSAYGGFDAASFNLSGPAGDIEEWLERGLGRHVEVWDNDLSRVWEGFVDQVSITQGQLTYTVGPLTDLANRVSCVYNGVDPQYNPPTQLGRLVTAVINATDSQARYGIWEKSVSAGGKTTAAMAALAAGSYLARRQTPARSQAVGGGGGASQATVQLKGYQAWLSAYTYAQTASSGTVAANALIRAILAADPNGIFSTDYSQIDANALVVVPAHENDATFAESLIKSTVALGDSSYNLWTFGIYEQRRAIYAQAPEVLAYRQSTQASDQDVYTLAGTRVRPWQVRPAQWILMDDFLVGKPLGAALATDLRCAFIEQVTFTAPYSVSWTGGPLGTLDQLLAQLTMRGMR